MQRPRGASRSAKTQRRSSDALDRQLPPLTTARYSLGVATLVSDTTCHDLVTPTKPTNSQVWDCPASRFLFIFYFHFFLPLPMIHKLPGRRCKILFFSTFFAKGGFPPCESIKSTREVSVLLRSLHAESMGHPTSIVRSANEQLDSRWAWRVGGL